MSVRPFTISISDAALADLGLRLQHTRWTDAVEGADWTYGSDPAFMHQLINYWRAPFNWRAEESRINRLPQFIGTVDGRDIHFLHVRGRGPKPLPLIITHGWPSSFVEFEKIIPLLTDPAAHGGNANDSFDVIAPSLPGFGFSAHPARSGTSSAAVTTLWMRLMTEVLGYRRFVAHGGDIGAGITNRLGRKYPDHVAGIHTMAVPDPPAERSHNLTAAEQTWLALVDTWQAKEGAYEHEQRTRPQTLAYGLNDSPVGLAAWIVEKWRAWSDCGGDVLSRFSMDTLLTNISVYWFTQTIGSSVRMYYETAQAPESPAAMIEVPARIYLTREAVNICPPEYAARSYANFSYGLAPRGGHFMAAEEPALLAQDIREAFRPLR